MHPRPHTLFVTETKLFRHFATAHCQRWQLRPKEVSDITAHESLLSYASGALSDSEAIHAVGSDGNSAVVWNRIRGAASAARDQRCFGTWQEPAVVRRHNLSRLLIAGVITLVLWAFHQLSEFVPAI